MVFVKLIVLSLILATLFDYQSRKSVSVDADQTIIAVVSGSFPTDMNSNKIDLPSKMV